MIEKCLPIIVQLKFRITAGILSSKYLDLDFTFLGEFFANSRFHNPRNLFSNLVKGFEFESSMRDGLRVKNSNPKFYNNFLKMSVEKFSKPGI